MISTEYPPMRGGVGRYTYNLTKSLRRLGLDVYVACHMDGNGDYPGISSSSNLNNASAILEIVHELHPDIVHIQYEHGLYGLSMDNKYPLKDIRYRKSHREYTIMPVCQHTAFL